MGLKVAIVGLSPSSHRMAPWHDKDWELWGLPWDAEYWCRMHRLFEMHAIKELQPAYLDRLRECDCLYMQEAYSEVPNAKRYPLEEVAKTTGDYWSSSIAYMLALAIHEGSEEIAIYGVDMDADGEYGYQKPNTEYLIGLARGKGIAVHIPEQSPLCKYAGDLGYVGRYGWLG